MNGVSTEDRFQKMTDIQWFLHYKMIIREEAEKWESQRNLVKTLMEIGTQSISDISEGAAELLALLIAPERYKVYADIKNNKNGDSKKEYKDMESEFQRLIESGEIPLEIEIEMGPSPDAVTLPIRSSRKLGIQKRSEVE